MHNSLVTIIRTEDSILLRVHNILHHMVIILHHRLQEAILVQAGSKDLQHQCMGPHLRLVLSSFYVCPCLVFYIYLIRCSYLMTFLYQGNYNYGQQPGPDYGHPAPYPQAPSQPYGHGYNEAKYDHPASGQHYGHMGSQPAPYAQGGAHSGYGGPQDQYGKPPMYGMQAQAPHSQPYGQPRPNQPGEVPYQGPSSATQSYGQNMPPPQQSYPYGSSAPMQQSYPPYGGTTDGYGHTPAAASASAYPQGGQQPVAGYGQPGAQQPATYPQTVPAGGYGSYPAAQPGYPEQPAANNTTYGYQGPTDPSAYGAAQAQSAYPATAAGQSGYAQPAQTQPTYEQSAGYGNVPAAAGYGKSASPQSAYPQYDSSQMYGAHR